MELIQFWMISMCSSNFRRPNRLERSMEEGCNALFLRIRIPYRTLILLNSHVACRARISILSHPVPLFSSSPLSFFRPSDLQRTLQTLESLFSNSDNRFKLFAFLVRTLYLSLRQTFSDLSLLWIKIKSEYWISECQITRLKVQKFDQE